MANFISDWGYHIIDEPLHNFPELARIHRAYRETDPDHLDYSNLISLGGDYLCSSMETVKSRLLSYDYYMYSQRTGGDTITYQDINEKWIDSHQGKQLIEFELAPGDGELFRIKRNNQFKTLRQEGKRY